MFTIALMVTWGSIIGLDGAFEYATAAAPAMSGVQTMVQDALKSAVTQPPAESPVADEPIRLTEDNTYIRQSAKVAPGVYRIIDEDENGAILIRGFNTVVDFQGAELLGSPEGTPPDRYHGYGVVVRGQGITIRNLEVHGYKVGIYAGMCLDLTIEDVDVSDNFRQRLNSTPQREATEDWLWPHRNDGGEWRDNYGAGVLLEKCDRATVRRVRAREVQNGIMLDRVNLGRVYDNDCSFLSGWGLAMWACDSCVVSRNAFDFCVRGYSHGVYNRGQDSAGILMFEGNTNNVIAENSATHGGDGLFGFAGRSALGEDWLDEQRAKLRAEHGREEVDDLITVPKEVVELHRRRGNNDNWIFGNDFSYAAAHGLEMTFSFGNCIMNNRFVGNAICGIWGGYSQATTIANNVFEANGDAGYGLERGGVNIEHGTGNVIAANTFRRNVCGVHLWSDDDKGTLRTPWALANHHGSRDNMVVSNTFEGDKLALHLRQSQNTKFVGNRLNEATKEVEADGASDVVREGETPEAPRISDEVRAKLIGDTRPVGARKNLAGREHIIMTEWGPYDHARFLVTPTRLGGGSSAEFRVLGRYIELEIIGGKGDVELSTMKEAVPAKVKVVAKRPGVWPFVVEVRTSDQTQQVTGTLVRADWSVAYYTWSPLEDPRCGEAPWTAITGREPISRLTAPAIDFVWRGGAPNEKTPADHFATVATATLIVPESSAGKWKAITVSDDGVRVFVDDKRVLENWTWHGPTRDEAEIDLPAGPHAFRIEHFEIDGYAQLQFELERMERP